MLINQAMVSGRGGDDLLATGTISKRDPVAPIRRSVVEVVAAPLSTRSIPAANSVRLKNRALPKPLPCPAIWVGPLSPAAYLVMLLHRYGQTRCIQPRWIENASGINSS